MSLLSLKGRVSTLFALLMLAGPAAAQLQVFTCEPEWAALARVLGGEQLEIYSATTYQQDPHHIQARPSLIARARRADLLVCTGAELEVGWLPLLLQKSANPRIQPGQTGHFMAADRVSLLDKPQRLDRSQGDVHAAGNPHIHLDPERLLQIAEQLSQRLMQLDPANRPAYQQRLDAFDRDWRQAIDRWRAKAQPLRGTAIVVHHNSWLYLVQWLGLKQLATLEQKPGIPPSSAHLSQLVSRLQQTPAEMILYASYQDSKAAYWLSERTGIPVIALDFSVAPDETLMQWFERLLDQLLGAQTATQATTRTGAQD